MEMVRFMLHEKGLPKDKLGRGCKHYNIFVK